jgi:hypothetical protein
MTKHLLTALLSSLLTALAVYAIQPIGAAEASAPDRPALAATDPFASRDLSMPPPQAPFDMTPITPFETVGGLAYEP